MAPRERMITERDDSNRSHGLSPIVSACQHLLQPNGSILGSEVARAILPQFPTMVSAIPSTMPHFQEPALGSIDGRRPISHSRTREFVLDEFGPAIHNLGFGKGHRIALVLPNGPELALAILSVANWAACVPLNANGASTELEADLQRCGADLVIGPYSGPIDSSSSSHESNEKFKVGKGGAGLNFSVYEHIEESAKKLNIPFVGLVPSPQESGIFRLVASRSITPVHYDDIKIPTQIQDTARILPNAHGDEVLVLFTSGTTGNKKLVPHTLGDMLVAAATIALSWNLTPSDINCNLMPLFHVGGIVRQVFSPILSGGCVICCPSFDPSIFWALLQKKAFTWYYAAPTMHQLILETGRQPASSTTDLTMIEETGPKLRMIANAAGGLLPSLARQLRETFHANVLPSYGMTECMPISSPPATYQLEKPGTSGVAVGPEVAILNLRTAKPLLPGQEGPICVRGEPCFRGYGKNYADPTQVHEDTFLKGGWFNTGDLGYLDSDGYLFITGRSKEVINRGGEIISPMEVEEAVLSHPDVLACAAFSAEHNVLQEVVGIVVVMVSGRPRLDLPTLHEFLGEQLAAPKWPQCLVFMDALPKSHTNKLLRVKLGQRMNLPELTDAMSPIERTFEADCPKQGTPVGTAITSNAVIAHATEVKKMLSAHLVLKLEQQLLVTHHPSRVGALVCYLWNVDRNDAIEVAQDCLDRYAVPSYFVSLDRRVGSEKELPLPLPTDSLAYLLQTQCGPVDDPLVQELQAVFQDLIGLEYLPGPETNFFNLGGSSMLASQLASRIRKRYEVACSGAEIFHHTTCNAIATMIRERREDSSGTSSQGDSSAAADTQGAPFPASRLTPQGGMLASLFQLVPIFVVIPMWQVTRFFLFFATLLRWLESAPGERDIFTFVCTYLVFHLGWVTVTPLVFVGIKWTIIGRYKAGRYPLWGNYYLRWWFVDICRKLFLRGIWGSNEPLLNFYYRLLGAKIGKDARISLEADVAEFDLVSIGDNAAIEYSTLRGFGVDNGAMILGPVSVGNDASVGARSVVAPYTSIPDGANLGPVTSSYETGKSLDPKFADVNRRNLPEPNMFMQMFVGAPIEFTAHAISQIPALLVLFWMLQMKGSRDELFENLGDLMKWLCDPARIPFYIGIRLARSIVAPPIYMAVAILVKKTIIGKFEAGPRDTTSQWQLLRHWLAATLFSRQKMQEVTELVGRHYELVSCLYRLLGAKVGKRVFWPGHQPVFTGEFDLLEVGDDVVFGSRSSIFCTTVNSCEKVVLCAGSNVADNCVVLPGSIIGKNAVLGSNSVCPRGWYLPEASVWFGSKGCEPDCLEKGVEINPPHLSSEVKMVQMHGDASTLRPFGKAFYLKQAPYFVWPLSLIVFFTLVVKCLLVTFHTLPLLGALHGSAALLYGLPISARDYYVDGYTFVNVYAALISMFAVTNFLRVSLWFAIDLTAKWTLMGQRAVGRYNYDTSPYAQNWELYQTIAKIRKFGRYNLMDFIAGTPLMTAYFRWSGCHIGKDCCLYPAGGDPYMSEPDLVIMGDRVVMDCASVVCHLNTRGNFELAKIVLENDTTLRTRSRVQQGVYMESGSMLLEKSLAMTGEVLEANSVWQGGPASWWFQYSRPAEKPHLEAKYSSDFVADESTKLLKESAIMLPIYYDSGEQKVDPDQFLVV